MRRRYSFFAFALHLCILATVLPVWGQQAQPVVTMQNAATATGNGTEIEAAAGGGNAMFNAVGIQISGTFTATVTFEVTFDSTNWTAVLATNLNDGALSTTANAPGTYSVLMAGATRMRARVSAYTSGSVTVKGRLIPGLISKASSSSGGSSTWGGITGTLSSQVDLQTALDAKAPLSSPAITGSPTAPSLGRTAAAGTNQAGSDFTTYAGAGTGTGLTGDYRIQLAATGSSGSAANPLVDRQIITKRKALTDATNVNLITITLPTLAGASGFLDYTAYAVNASDVQVRRGVIGFSVINKAGVYTTETSVADESVVASTGTLTCTFNFSNGTNQTTLRANCDTSFTSPTTFYLIYQVRNQSEQAMTIK